MLKVLTHPINEVIFENTLDKLVEEVRSYQLVNICTRKALSERLTKCEICCVPKEAEWHSQ